VQLLSRDVPVGSPNGNDGTQAYAKENADNEGHSEIHINKYHVDYDYLKTLGMQMVNRKPYFSP
jgi:hypothetical protein